MEEKKIFVNGPAGKLEARFFMDGSSDLLGIVCHPHPLYQGSMDNKVVTTVVKAWRQVRMSTLRFNFRGVGLSEGAYAKGEGEEADLHAIIHWVQENYPSVKIWLAGFSFGGSMVFKTALRREFSITGLITIAPALDFLNIQDSNINRQDINWNANTTKTNNANTSNLSVFGAEIPWLLVQGMEDELIPVEQVISFFKSLSFAKEAKDLLEFTLPDGNRVITRSNSHHKLILFPKTTHFFHGKLILLMETIKQFVLEIKG